MEKLVFTNNIKDKILNILSSRGFSYNKACEILRNKDVKIDGVRAKENIFVENGSVIEVFYDNYALFSYFDKIFEDDNVLVLYKKSGIEVEGKDGLEGKTGAIAVHRLDRNTEGVMIMAKNKIAENCLLKAFKNHNVTKKYLAEVVGRAEFDGKIKTAYLEKNASQSKVKVFANAAPGREEIKTAFKTIKAGAESSLVECDLLTGKTHQIRAHLAYLGYPIIGDGKYGRNSNNKKFKQKRQQLRCFYLKINIIDEPLKYLEGREFVRK